MHLGSTSHIQRPYTAHASVSGHSAIKAVATMSKAPAGALVSQGGKSDLLSAVLVVTNGTCVSRFLRNEAHACVRTCRIISEKTLLWRPGVRFQYTQQPPRKPHFHSSFHSSRLKVPPHTPRPLSVTSRGDLGRQGGTMLLLTALLGAAASTAAAVDIQVLHWNDIRARCGPRRFP
jgi:hypothetical protein